MGFTTFCLDNAQIALLDWHLDRLDPLLSGRAELEAQLARWCVTAPDGVYSATYARGNMTLSGPRQSRLYEGVLVRLCPSPFQAFTGAFAKPSTGYEQVRATTHVSLLTSADSAEIFEACVAGVLAVNNGKLTMTPTDRPRVASLTERFLNQHFDVVRAPIFTRGTAPLAAFNSAVGIVPLRMVGREAFPQGLADSLQQVFLSTRRRPDAVNSM
jgi:hypothetical protein